MELTAIFESWHIGDGNYPPLRRGQPVNLSFEFEPRGALTIAPGEPSWRHVGSAEYTIAAHVIWHSDVLSTRIAVLEAAGFRFYVHGSQASRLTKGASVSGSGTLLLDHYLWAENLRKLPDPPNLFYPLIVECIRRVRIPERFVTRHASGKSLPTRLGPSDYSSAHVQELETMEGQSLDEEFFIIDFTTRGVDSSAIPRTFFG